MALLPEQVRQLSVPGGSGLLGNDVQVLPGRYRGWYSLSLAGGELMVLSGWTEPNLGVAKRWHLGAGFRVDAQTGEVGLLELTAPVIFSNQSGLGVSLKTQEYAVDNGERGLLAATAVVSSGLWSTGRCRNYANQAISAGALERLPQTVDAGLAIDSLVLAALTNDLRHPQEILGGALQY